MVSISSLHTLQPPPKSPLLLEWTLSMLVKLPESPLTSQPMSPAQESTRAPYLSLVSSHSGTLSHFPLPSYWASVSMSRLTPALSHTSFTRAGNEGPLG